MTGQEWAAWTALAGFSCLYLIGAIVGAVYSGPANPRPKDDTAAGATSDSPDGDARPTAAVGVARGLSMLALIGASLSLAFGLLTNDEVRAWQFAAAGAGMSAALGALHLILSAIPVRGNLRLRRQMGPVSGFLNWLASKSTSARVRASATRAGPTDPAPGEISAALTQNLERLERTALGGDTGELRMIKAVLAMDTARVREIMRPRVDMVAARADATPEELTALINDRGHSKIPVYAETIDDIVGVVYARDLLRIQSRNGGDRKTAREIARPAIIVPESQRLEQLLREFQRHRTQIAIVVDEYGGVSGLVTVQDLIEEIVGEIVDEFDRNEPDVERISDSEATMDARLPIDSFNEMFGVQITAEGFDTVGGLVYRELGKMPVVGDTVDVENLRIAVESTMGRRIRRLRVKKLPEMSDSAV